MNIVLNIIWVVFGGLMIAIEYAVASIGMMVTIIGIPFGLQTLKLAAVALWPFGTAARSSGWPSGCLCRRDERHLVVSGRCGHSADPSALGAGVLHHHCRNTLPECNTSNL